MGGNISGAVLAVDSYGSADVTLVNTIVENNSLSYASNPNFSPSGGVISYNSGSGHLKLINSTVVNNQTTTINDWLNYEHTGSVIGMSDVNSDGDSPYPVSYTHLTLPTKA